MSRVQRPKCSVQSPEARVQHPDSRVQRPESSVQSPVFRVQRPTLATRVQNSGMSISCFLLSKSVISKLFTSPRDSAIKINLIGVLLLHSMVFNFTVISAYFKVCNNDNRSVTLSIVLLPLLLSLNMFILFAILLDKLRFIALFVIIFFAVATLQALSWSFNRKTLLKSLFRSFCFLSICHAIR